MTETQEKLDEARKEELLDLTLRNPLISHKTRKTRGAKVVDERPEEVYRILVKEEKRMSFEAQEEKSSENSEEARPEDGQSEKLQEEGNSTKGISDSDNLSEDEGGTSGEDHPESGDPDEFVGIGFATDNFTSEDASQGNEDTRSDGDGQTEDADPLLSRFSKRRNNTYRGPEDLDENEFLSVLYSIDPSIQGQVAAEIQRSGDPIRSALKQFNPELAEDHAERVEAGGPGAKPEKTVDLIREAAVKSENEGSVTDVFGTGEDSEPDESGSESRGDLGSKNPQARPLSGQDQLRDGEDVPDRHLDSILQTPHGPEGLQDRLLSSYHRAERAVKEKGVNTLYLALGMLRWHESRSSDVERRAPVLLLPVELSRTDARGRFRLKHRGEEAKGNLSLKAYLDANFSINWPLPAGGQLAGGNSSEGDLEGGPEGEKGAGSAGGVLEYFREVSEAVAHKDRWTIDHRAVELGFFSFSRYLMHEDLSEEHWPEGQSPGEHPVLQELLDGGFDPEPLPFEGAARLDDHLGPEDTHHVVEADSSQTEAILAVKEGRNLVLQGPPGTGKSQTITNIIAEAIGQGKTVLFASEKKAALEVVKRNLDEALLGDACLELHSHNAQKKEVLEELDRTLGLGRPQVEDFSEQAEIKTKARDQLNDYADAVNEPIGESGVRPYDAYGQLEQLSSTLGKTESSFPDAEGSFPQVEKIKTGGMAEWTSQERRERELVAERLESQVKSMGTPSAHPFWGSQKTSFLRRDASEIERAAEKALQALSEAQKAVEALAEGLCLEVPGAPREASRLVRAGEQVAKAPTRALRQVNPTSSAWKEQAALLEEIVEAGTRLSEIRESHGQTLIPEAWEADVLETRQALASYGQKWYRWLVGDWRSAKADLAGLCKEGARGEGLPQSHEDRLALADAILEAQRLSEKIETGSEVAREAFGRAWRGEGTDWTQVRKALDYLVETYEAVEDKNPRSDSSEGDSPQGPPAEEAPANGGLPEGLISGFLQGASQEEIRGRTERLKEAREARVEAARAFSEAIAFDPEVRLGSAVPLCKRPYEVQQDLLARCEAEPHRVQEIVSYNQLAEEVREGEAWEEDMEGLLEVARSWKAAGAYLTDAFQNAYLSALLERAMSGRPALRRFSRAQHEQVIQRFRKLDRASLHHNRHALALKHYEGIPSKKGIGEMGTLLHEIGKKSRHMPLRKLMEKAGSAIQQIKPVFMMSPMSVPKYLPPGSIDFDLVVFDEASQVRPVDAFGSILRGGQTVVVGDNKQLPPTSFFEASASPDRDGYERRAGDQESILDLFLSRGATEKMLRFHYRSRHESLIAVSNKEFYGNDLNVFPSPDAGQEETGLRFNHLPEATYDRGGSRKNKREAEVVVERVMEHARRNSGMSLGVATFSSAQQEAIRERLEHERRQDPSKEDFFSSHPNEPFFVKNLESVQGDQRDVIFISVGYGKDENGRTSMNFGPLNRQGGERRLNVLTTRAKYRCEVFTNLKAGDIDLSRTDARGVEVLKEYLQFAETGELGLPDVSGREPDSPFEKAVADRLRSEGYDVDCQVGVAGFRIDLAVRDPGQPGRYVLGIECDGATYHSSRMARVRDRTRQAVLESLGWDIHRIWSTDWFRAPEKELRAATEAIGRAVREIEESGKASGPSEAETNKAETSKTEMESDTGQAEVGEGAETAQDSEVGGGESGRTAGRGKSDEETSSAARRMEAGGGAPSGRDELPKDGPSEDGFLEDGALKDKSLEGNLQREEKEEKGGVLEAQPYRRASFGTNARKDVHELPPGKVAGWICRIVETESPVRKEVACYRTLEMTEATRMGSRIQDAFEQGIAHAREQGQISEKIFGGKHVLLDPSQEEIPVRDREDIEGRAGNIEYVPHLEIEEAAGRVAKAAINPEKEELVEAVGRLLGFGRITSKIRERIESVISAMTIGSVVGALVEDKAQGEEK